MRYKSAFARKLRRLGLCALAAWACLAAACSPPTSPSPSNITGIQQVIQEWSFSAPSPSYGDASGAVAMGDTLMFVNNNEDNILRLYPRYPSTPCKLPIYAISMTPNLNISGGDTTVDIEAAVKLVDANGTRIYWIGSESNSPSGSARPNRDRIFATQVNGDGTGSPPYTLTYVGRYNHLRDDLIAWDVNNHHGLGANYFGLAASAASGVSAKRINGYNIEGLTLAPDGNTAYIGFRAPFVNGSGPTTPTTPNSARTDALIVPLLNMPALVAGNPTPGPGAAQFGAPIRLNLHYRGVRSIDYTYPGQYLITAGPTDVVSTPPVNPFDFRLFTWSGNPLDAPVERATGFAGTYSPEGCILPNSPIVESTVAQFVSDDGGSTCWRSITCFVGAAVSPTTVPASPRTHSVTASRPRSARARQSTGN